MKWNPSRATRSWTKATASGIVVVSAALTFPLWWPTLTTWIDLAMQQRPTSDFVGSEDTNGKMPAVIETHEGHAHNGHAASLSIELSPQALKNLGLTPEFLRPIALGSYKRTISVPAIVAARPGRTQIHVSSPLSGVVTHVHAVTGEAVTAGHLLFEVRLTYEDLVDTQTQFLKTLSELEVEDREIARLEDVGRSGVLPGKTLMDRRYAKEKLEAYLGSMREALKLHGLSETQIAVIENERKLLRELAIEAPDIDSHGKDEELRLSQRPVQPASYRALQNPDAHADSRPLIVEDLKVQKGQGVISGEMLCALSDFSHLYVEGQAFEQDAPAVALAAERGWTIDAMLQTATGAERIPGLKLAYVGSSVDTASRSLSFFVELPNSILRDETNAEGQRFVTWKYRVGQRLQLQVPVEVWDEQIVLPVDAVVKDGVDWFVFQQNGDHFDRVAVHVKHRDPTSVVIDNDGAIYPGDFVALKSAHQLQMALKNKSGSGADPHAGHGH